jgi:hypothetical protein
MKHKQKRTALIKGYTTDETKASLQKVCAALGKSVSDFVNDCTIVIIRDHLDARPKRNDMPPFPGGDRPKPHESRAHINSCPRPSYGAIPRMKLRV